MSDASVNLTDGSEDDEEPIRSSYGLGMSCPYCRRPFQSRSAVSGHAPFCGIELAERLKKVILKSQHFQVYLPGGCLWRLTFAEENKPERE